SPSTCGNFQYQITSQTASTIAGTFTAICGGGLAVSGQASGQLNGTAVSLTASGTASRPGIPSCAFTLTGNGAIEDNGNTLRVPWALRGEGGGLRIKNGGENIIGWQGYSFAAGRICYPDGHIFKVLTDVPTTNGPSWQDNGFVDRSLYVPAIDPNR